MKAYHLIHFFAKVCATCSVETDTFDILCQWSINSFRLIQICYDKPKRY